MIHLACSVPSKIYLACSGGSDSMAALNFFINGRKDVTVLYFNHGTAHSEAVHNPLANYCEMLSIEFKAGFITRPKEKQESLEEYWRNQRYEFFNQFTDYPIITCHHLDDAVETWLFSSIHGEGRLIPVRQRQYVRPFLLTRKQDLLQWCTDNFVPFWEDQSNAECEHARNFIRNVLMPGVLRINPGIHKVIKKKYLSATK
jgi:tRNA(Ile)-lysidine synthetase-like protein